MSKNELKKNILKLMNNFSDSQKISKLSLFGSHLRGEARIESDVDLLVEFCEPIGYFELVRIEDKLTKQLGKRVDLVTASALSKYFRNEVIKQAEIIYEK